MNEPFGHPSEIETLAERARLAKRRALCASSALKLTVATMIGPIIGVFFWSRAFPKNWAEQPHSVPFGFWVLAVLAVALVIAALSLAVVAGIRDGQQQRAAQVHFEAEKAARIAAQVEAAKP